MDIVTGDSSWRKVRWWGWNSSKKHKSRSALALDLTGSQSYAPRLEGSGMAGGPWFGGGRWGHGRCPRCWSGGSTGPWLALDAPGPGGSVTSRHSRWVTHPLLVCFPSRGAGNTASILFPFPKVPLVSAFQIGLEQELLLSICYTSPKHASWHWLRGSPGPLT